MSVHPSNRRRSAQPAPRPPQRAPARPAPQPVTAHSAPVAPSVVEELSARLVNIVAERLLQYEPALRDLRFATQMEAAIDGRPLQREREHWDSRAAVIEMRAIAAEIRLLAQEAKRDVYYARANIRTLAPAVPTPRSRQ